MTTAPREMLVSNGGDREDFTAAKYFTPRQLSVPDYKMRLTYAICRLGTSCLPATAEHRQFPVPFRHCMAHNVDAVVVAADLEVTIIRAIPLVEDLDNPYPALFQIKTNGSLLAAIAGIAFHPYV